MKELLGQTIFKSKNYELLKQELLNRYINKRNLIAYDEFKDLIKQFVEEIM